MATTTVLCARARPARPRAFSASRVSPTRTSFSSSPDGKLRSTTAQTALCSKAAATKAWPSRFGPLMAMKPSPLVRLRESIDRPVTGASGTPRQMPPVAAPISPNVQSGSANLSLLLQSNLNCVVIAKRNHRGPDSLSGLVALTGDEQDIAPLKLGNCLSDSARTISDLERSRRCRQDLAANVVRPFAARIVVGDDGKVRLLHRQ